MNFLQLFEDQHPNLADFKERYPTAYQLLLAYEVVFDTDIDDPYDDMSPLHVRTMYRKGHAWFGLFYKDVFYMLDHSLVGRDQMAVDIIECEDDDPSNGESLNHEAEETFSTSDLTSLVQYVKRIIDHDEGGEPEPDPEWNPSPNKKLAYA